MEVVIPVISVPARMGIPAATKSSTTSTALLCWAAIISTAGIGRGLFPWITPSSGKRSTNVQIPDQLAGKRWYTWVLQRIDVFWTAGHCSRDGVSRVWFYCSLGSLSSYRTCPGYLKTVCHAKKRDREKVWSHGNIRTREADKRWDEVTWQDHQRGCKW